MHIFLLICVIGDECTLVQTGYVAFARETIVSLAPLVKPSFDTTRGWDVACFHLFEYKKH